MVRQTIKNVNLKNLKMAKDVLAVFEVMGITEEQIDKLFTVFDEIENTKRYFEGLIKVKNEEITLLKQKNEELEGKISDLEDFKVETLRIRANEQKGGTNKSIGDQMQELFSQKVEEFNPNAQ